MQEPSMLRREASIATRLSVYILEPVIKHFPTGFDRTCRLILSVLHTPYVCGTSDKGVRLFFRPSRPELSVTPSLV